MWERLPLDDAIVAGIRAFRDTYAGDEPRDASCSASLMAGHPLQVWNHRRDHSVRVLQEATRCDGSSFRLPL